jgi:hypothetical protein
MKYIVMRNQPGHRKYLTPFTGRKLFWQEINPTFCHAEGDIRRISGNESTII